MSNNTFNVTTYALIAMSLRDQDLKGVDCIYETYPQLFELTCELAEAVEALYGSGIGGVASAERKQRVTNLLPIIEKLLNEVNA